MTKKELYIKSRKHYIHWLKFTVPKNKGFDHPICYNGKLSELLDTSFKRMKNELQKKSSGEGVNAEYLQELQQRLNPNT